MKIIHISDMHLVPDGNLLFDEDPVKRLQACIADVNQCHVDADLCVITGDLAHDGDEASYRILAACLANLRPPVRLLLGNHDDRPTFRRVFPEAPVDENGFVQSVHDSASGRLIFLDTKEAGTHEGRLCTDRLTWLQNALNGAVGKPVFLFLHHPAFDLNLPSVDWIRLREEQPLRHLVAVHGDVRYMFSGHVHRPSAGTWYGTPFSTVPGTNHQHALDFNLQGPATTSMEAPAYSVISLRESGVTVHFHAFMDASRRYPFLG
ncbi:MAG: phosphodiesterase [Glaciimonas sp.]|nr:phosphodiesterase [Glaciimonas sp.]